MKRNMKGKSMGYYEIEVTSELNAKMIEIATKELVHNDIS